MPSFRNDGDCFKTAFHEAHEMEKAGKRGVKLVHAEVSGQGVSPRHVHAWVEYDVELDAPPEALESMGFPPDFTIRYAVDKANGHDAHIAAALYRSLGDVTNVHEYTTSEARAEVWDRETYGPWGWESSTGL